MQNFYREKYPESTIKYSYYIKFFHEHFNLHFGRPQINTCCQCEDLRIKIKSPSLGEAAKISAVAEIMIHKRAKIFYNAVQDTTKEIQERNYNSAIAFDFMQNLQLPEVPV